MDLRETPASPSAKRTNPLHARLGAEDSQRRVLPAPPTPGIRRRYQNSIDAHNVVCRSSGQAQRMLSIGVVGRDLNSPTYYGNRFRPIVETSLGFRPLGERFTVFANYLARDRELAVHAPDATAPPVETQPESFFTYGIEAELASGFLFRLGADEDENLSASLSLLARQRRPDFASLLGERLPVVTSEYTATGVLSVSPFWRDNALAPGTAILRSSSAQNRRGQAAVQHLGRRPAVHSEGSA